MTTNAAAPAARTARTIDAVMTLIVVGSVASAFFAPHMWLSHDIAGHIVHILDVIDSEVHHVLHGIHHRVAHRRTGAHAA
jgi:hypothetical protein